MGSRRRRSPARPAAARARAAPRPPRRLLGLPHGQLARAVLPQSVDGLDPVGRQGLRRRHSHCAHRGLRRRRRQDGMGAAAARRARAPRLDRDRVGRHWEVVGATEEGRELACQDKLRPRVQPPRPSTQLLRPAGPLQRRLLHLRKQLPRLAASRRPPAWLIVVLLRDTSSRLGLESPPTPFVCALPGILNMSSVELNRLETFSVPALRGSSQTRRALKPPRPRASRGFRITGDGNDEQRAVTSLLPRNSVGGPTGVGSRCKCQLRQAGGLARGTIDTTAAAPRHDRNGWPAPVERRRNSACGDTTIFLE
ncbi:hypothetical protein BC567DRAFT_239303 [Phyllosticta citribraziliensis]